MKLKLCPFCASPAVLCHDSGHEVWPQTWSVRCQQCWCKTPNYPGSNVFDPNRDLDKDRQAESLAIQQWNQRVH